jgi:hypothetical protein
MLEAVHLTKHYNGVTALDDLTLRIAGRGVLPARRQRRREDDDDQSLPQLRGADVLTRKLFG